MGQVSETVHIDAPVEVVWEHLSDFGGIARWNPVLRASRLLSARSEGVGATRHCDIAPSGYVRERAVAWEERSLVAWVIEETDTPMKRSRNAISLRPAGSATLATFELDYTLKGGPLGSVMDVLVARRKMSEAARKTLGGLKARSERVLAGAVQP